MAITFLGSSSWSFDTITTDTIGLVGGETADTRIFALASWKDFSITATVTGDAAYTELTEFADGSVGAGAGVGSMKVGGWYRDFGTGTSPTITYSSAPSIAGITLLEFNKASTDTWDTPLFATAAWPITATTQTISASSTVAVKDGSVVMAIIGIRDDSALFTRAATTGIDVSSGITWAGDYQEQPATHLSTTTGGDMAADTGYRLVTTGGTVTLRVTATISAVETGSILWIMQGVTAAAGGGQVPKSSPYPQLLAH